MNHAVKKLPQSQVEITITITPEEYQKDLENAAKKLSERTAVKGFRKGKVPFDIMKKELGEMTILQEALETIVQRSYFKIIVDEKLDVIGMPQINVTKAAPGNDVEFTATVAQLPEVKLPKIDSLKVKREEVKVDEKKVEETLEAIRGMHATEVKKDGAAEGTDKLVMDMDMFIDKVPIEGGQTKDYQVYLSENHYIPGFNDQVKGLKAGEEKEFTLDFPKDHFQKHLAGKKVDIKVKIKDVFSRELAELTDDFAKSLGQESVKKLTETIRSNVAEEAEKKAAQATEIAVLEALVEKSKINEVPEVLINNERQKMFHELLRDLERLGVSTEQYLADIKKTEEELFESFKDQAIKRAKTALISRQIAKEQGINISNEDLKQEVELLKGMYKDNDEALKNLDRTEVQETIAVSMQNRRVMEWLQKELFGEEEKK